LTVIRFGVFEADLGSEELRKQGTRLKLQQQPFRVLALLLERSGQVVTREELRQTLWPNTAFGSFDEGLDATIHKLRSALGDSADSPRFIETLPRRGYRFIAPIDTAASPASTSKMPPARLLMVLGGGAVAIVALVVMFAQRPGSSPASVTSIAVLPFTNLSGSQDDEYFSDGMTEELITALSRINGLRVAARTSAFTFKGRTVDAREIGRELHVGTLVEGAVQRSAGRLRVTARLVNAADGYQVWSEQYERDVRDLFAVQDEISRAVANALQVTLARGNDSGPVRRPTQSNEAHDLYLRGRYFLGLRTDETSLRKSVEYFDRAIQADSTYASAYSGLSDAYSVLSIWGFIPPREGFPRAKAAALRALALDSTLAAAHTSLGIVSLWFDLDGEASRRELTRAIALDPRYPAAHLFYAWYLAFRESPAAAVEEARRARELDPLSIIVNTRVGTMLYFAGRYDEALGQLRATLELDSSNAMANAELGRVLVELNRCPEALEAFRHLPASFQNVERGVTGYAYAVCGRRGDAVALLHELEAQSRGRFVFASRIAVLQIGLGAYDEAFAWFDRAIQQRDPMSQALAVEPLYRPLRGDPRFQTLLVKAGLQPRR
jgi:TolB-like protein/DNA-binding winged helix-turn-helix (wHTH) protein